MPTLCHQHHNITTTLRRSLATAASKLARGMICAMVVGLYQRATLKEGLMASESVHAGRAFYGCKFMSTAGGKEGYHKRDRKHHGMKLHMHRNTMFAPEAGCQRPLGELQAAEADGFA